MQSFQALIHFQFDAFHLVGDFQRESRLFVQFDVVVSHFGGDVPHEKHFQQNRLILNGRKAFIIVQKQSLY